jgi:exodeoxyribonuclease V alpha subunit
MAAPETLNLFEGGRRSLDSFRKGEELALEGDIARVTYERPETGFRIIQLEFETAPKKLARIAVVGVMPPVGKGSRVRVRGTYEVDSRHGPQLKFLSMTELAPETLAGIERYLSSGVIRGIGAKFAARIVEAFGLDTLRVLDEEPSRLRSVEGIGKRKADEIVKSWHEQRATRDVMLFLQTFGASPNLAARIAKRYGRDAMRIVKEDPYRLSLDVWGVGFRTADRIAAELGVAPDSERRRAAALLHCARTDSEQGNVYASPEALFATTLSLLDNDDTASEQALEKPLLGLVQEGHLVREEESGLLSAKDPALAKLLVQSDRIYLPEMHAAEVTVAEKLAVMAKRTSADRIDSAAAITRFENEQHVQLAPEQKAAIELAAKTPLVVITGGPGVGKTTIVRAVLTMFTSQRKVVRLAAPTGRAAKRMTETTGLEALTLHRLLEFDPRKRVFQRNEENLLEGDVLIVDECSMVDVLLAQALFAAIPRAMRVILVGDVDQLASVGPGAMLRDVIGSGVVPYVRLTQIFRQSNLSLIVENAHRINQGEAPTSSDRPDADFFVIERTDPLAAAQTIIELVTKRIPSRFGYDPTRDIQVLTPMHRGPCGSLALNLALQQAINPSGDKVQDANVDAVVEATPANTRPAMRPGDKVMQLRNDYDHGVFNGDVGIVSGVGTEGSIEVKFDDDRVVKYERTSLDDLTLSYACSVHKSQGSEYPVVVVALLRAHFVMLSRNLLYTGVTRGKRLVVLVTDKKALSLALGRAVGDERRTGLIGRLRRLSEQ